MAKKKLTPETRAKLVEVRREVRALREILERKLEHLQS
jgi:hypothetical protein